MKKFHDKKECFFCHSTQNLQVHHIFQSPRRQLSEKLGLVVTLCMDHHTGRFGIHTHPKMDGALKEQAQEWWEHQEGNSHKKWMEIMGKNYKK